MSYLDSNASHASASAVEMTTSLLSSLRTWIFWRVAFNSIVAFHRGIIHCCLNPRKNIFCVKVQRATTLFRSKFYLVLHLIIEPLFVLINQIIQQTWRINTSITKIMKLQLLASAALALLAAVPGAVSEVSTHHMVMNTNLFASLYLVYN